MNNSNITEIEFQLKKLATKNVDIFENYQWSSEHLRWVELIFALVLAITKKPEDKLKDIIVELDNLELLDIDILSEISKVGGDIDLNFPNSRRIFKFLLESGFSKKDSKSSILVMHEAAKSLKKIHNGKIQKYLRKYGQQMLDELPQNFTFSKMNKTDIKYAFTFWLQNILNMPISLSDSSTHKFCNMFKIKPKKLIETADKLDINLAVVDDLVLLHMNEIKAGKK